MATTINLGGVTLQNEGVNPLGVPVKMTADGISMGNSTISFTNILVLPDVLPALRMAPNSHTLKVDNNVAVVDTNYPYKSANVGVGMITLGDTDQQFYSSIDNGYGYGKPTLSLAENGPGISSTLDSSKLQFMNGVASPFMELNANNQLWIENTSTLPIIINSTHSQITLGDVGNQGNYTRIAVDDTVRIIELNSVDIIGNIGSGSSPYFTLPIHFTTKWSANYNYTNTNNWELVASTTMNIPPQYFTLSTYQVWKSEVAFNCFNMSPQTDKAFAMYLEFIDSTGNPFSGFSFNYSYPFTTRKNNSTYTFTSNNSENFCWTDHIDFSSGTSGGPFTINLHRYADNPMSGEFNAIISLSKTNLV
jgi:hypothetical protein